MLDRTFLISLLIVLLTGSAAIFEKASLKGATPLTVFTIRSLFMTLCLVVVGLFSQGMRPLVEVSGRTLLLIFIPAAFATIFVGLYFSILKDDLASRVVPIIGAAPLVTVLLSVLFLGEPFSWKRFLGAVLIALGIALVK